MKNIFLHFILCISVLHSRAQSIAPSSIEDSVIGWMKVYNFKGAKEPVKVENKLYSANQLSICDSFANWIQASYIPKGGLGDVKRTVTGKLGAYNKNTAALPQSYGAEASTYVFLKYNSNRKMVPENSLSLSWTIMANGVPGWEARDISNPAEYYFTMPSFETAFDGEATAKRYDLSKVPPIKPYISFWIKNIEAGNGTNYVLLCKDNRSPFVKLTKGEFLHLLEKAIPRIYQEEKRKLYEKEQGNQKSIAVFMKVLDDSKEKRVENLKKLKEKYKDRLNEIALTSAQPSIYDLDNGRDVFSNGYMSDQESTSGRVPVYKVDSAMAARCKTDKPQWILISWWWTPNNRVEKYMHESILNNFNFDYVYNFFFDAEKVKGQPYKPVRSPYAKELVVVTNASNAATANAKDKNIHFFEDFSTTVVGKKPNGWHTSLGSDGSTSVIANPAGLDGNWALIRDYTLKATQLKKPLPQNFTLTYELVAAQNFTWGAKGLTFELSKETSPGNAESFLKLRLRPGYDGRDGETVIETKFPSPPGYSNGTKWLTAPGFSNNKKNNHIILTIKKTEETLQIFIDKTKIAEYEKAIPAAHLFNAMSFYSVNAGENDKFYISNIKVTKD
ncbi:MAG TPA: hypothetical protein VGD17_01645 [Chitinophagaceae bacterium]